jgi:hypothetical protein
MMKWYREKLYKEYRCYKWNSFTAFRSVQVPIVTERVTVVGNGGDGDISKLVGIAWTLTDDTEQRKWREVAIRLSKSSLRLNRFETINRPTINDGDEEEIYIYRNLHHHAVNEEVMAFFYSLKDEDFGNNGVKPLKRNAKISGCSKARFSIIIDRSSFLILLRVLQGNIL